MDIGFHLGLNGRLSRGAYVLISLPMIALLSALKLFGWVSAAIQGLPEPAAVLSLVGLPLLWIYLAASWKRFHDRGRSGWWSLLLLIPIVNFFVWLIDLVIGGGDRGRNAYGPDPRQGSRHGPEAAAFD